MLLLTSPAPLASTPLAPAILAASLRQAPTAPAGWKRVEMKGDQIGYAPEDLPKGKLVGIVLWPEEAAAGDLKAWFTKKAPTMGAKGGKFQGDASIVLTSGVNGGRPFILGAVRPAGSSTRARVAMLFGDGDVLANYQDGFTALMKEIRSGKKGSAATENGTERGGGRSNGARDRRSPDEKDWDGLPASNPAKPLPAATSNGAKVFIIYTNTYGLNGMEVRHDPLILFPDGTAFSGAPDKPVSAFDPAHLKAAFTPYDVGRWAITGNAMKLTWPKRTRDTGEAYRKIGDGWTREADAKPTDAWNIYRRVVPISTAKIQGEWKTESLVTSGMMGGGTPMVAAGSSGTLAFKGSRYSDAMSRFASATTANMGDAFKSGGDVGVYGKGKDGGSGRYRIDGLLITRERYGKRGIDLVFLMPNWDGDKMGAMMIGDRRYERPDKK